MATEIKLRNPATGKETSAYRGYSWTSLCFGGIPALLRGDFLIGLLVIAATVVMAFLMLSQGLQPWIGSAIVGIAWGFFYNDIHLQRKQRQGYEIVQA